MTARPTTARPTTARRWTRAARAALRGLAGRYLAAYAETAWVAQYGPGLAPTAPLRVAPPRRAPTPAAFRVRTLGAARRPSGFRAPGRPGAAHTPASRSPAHPSASA
jgi:hypothetical protein